MKQETPTIFIKDRSGKIYKRSKDGMIVRATLDEIKRFVTTDRDSIPYTNLIKRIQLPEGNNNS